MEDASVQRPEVARRQTTAISYLSSYKELYVPPYVRLMVFSPHPDDETLAAGGLIQRVLAKEGKVEVVFITNGDGFRDGVRTEVKGPVITSADYIQYGKHRQQEAEQALCELGVQASEGIFFGFPDDGIDDLWARCWSKLQPYKSPTTSLDRAEYNGSFARLAKYAGANLEDEIIRALREFSPDWVVIPDPRDGHPDHCTTGVFVLEALRELNQKGKLSFRHTQILTYLVHYYDYPSASEWTKYITRTGIGGSPVSDDTLASIKWMNLPLTSKEQEGKSAALHAYQSQFKVIPDLLNQFMIPYELFGQLDAGQAMAVPQEYAIQLQRK
ncbi:MAG: PIG-L deacetylase family protein [Acidobacteriota bacterium]